MLMLNFDFTHEEGWTHARTAPFAYAADTPRSRQSGRSFGTAAPDAVGAVPSTEGSGAAPGYQPVRAQDQANPLHDCRPAPAASGRQCIASGTAGGTGPAAVVRRPGGPVAHGNRMPQLLPMADADH